MSLMERLKGKTEVVEKEEKKEEKFEESEKMYAILDKIQEKLIEKSEEQDIESEEIEGKISEILEEIIVADKLFFSRKEKEVIILKAMDEIVGFGPISRLIAQEEVTEIMVNGPDSIYVEISGKLHKSDVRFRNSEQLMKIIEKIVSPLGRRIDESSPMVDARLPDGSRINAVIPPLSLNGPVLTIRKFSDDPFTVKDLINFGTMTPEVAEFLKSCVQAKLNILISGGTGSGKTTTLNVVSSFIPANERIVTIEDAAELKLHQDHVVRLESRPANIEGKGAIVIRDLVKNSLRMRPDRIIVGEVRSGEALDMLQAMNTGHDGSITTGHANSPRDMIARIETMVLMAGMDLPLRAIREQIASAIDIIIQQSRMKDGTRKITSIVEIQGMENDVITLQEIFKFEYMGVGSKGKIKGKLMSTGIKPKILEKFKEAGIIFDEVIFSNNQPF